MTYLSTTRCTNESHHFPRIDREIKAYTDLAPYFEQVKTIYEERIWSKLKYLAIWSWRIAKWHVSDHYVPSRMVDRLRSFAWQSIDWRGRALVDSLHEMSMMK
jgi:hypothetical protein